MKKVLVLGTGAQGTTVIKRLELEPNVEKVICADYNEAAAKELASTLTKAEGCFVNAGDKEDIKKLMEDCDLVVNALPLDFGKNVLEAAIETKTNYQDFASCEGIADTWEEGMEIMLTEYSEKFKEAGILGIIGTGSAPGLMCVVARETVKHVDKAESMYMMVYEGVRTKRFIPYWWSPVVALNDMVDLPIAWEDGKLINTVPFTRPITREWDYVGYPVRFVEHAHDEPFYVGRFADEYFKGVKNVYFKYGGTGIEFAEPLSKAGLLKREPETIKGVEIAPFDVVLSHIPLAPKFTEEIKEIIDEGIIEDNGAFVCEVMGQKDGKDVRIESHVYAPGLQESFERFGISGEQYLTGQSGFLFTKLFVNDKLGDQTGLISSAQMTEEANAQYMKWANELDITVEVREVYDDPFYKDQEW